MNDAPFPLARGTLILLLYLCNTMSLFHRQPYFSNTGVQCLKKKSLFQWLDPGDYTSVEWNSWLEAYPLQTSVPSLRYGSIDKNQKGWNTTMLSSFWLKLLRKPTSQCAFSHFWRQENNIAKVLRNAYHICFMRRDGENATARYGVRNNSASWQPGRNFNATNFVQRTNMSTTRTSEEKE